MFQLLMYLVVLAGFGATWLYLQQHPIWREDRGSIEPGWWKPLAMLWLVVLVLFVLFASAAFGFHWGMLLVFPLLAAAVALCVVLLRLTGQGQ
jgi:cytochrome bd-type quinol oxidase subunit 2